MTTPDNKFSYPVQRTLGGVLQEMADRNGHRPVIFHFDECLTYSDLNERSKQIARSLLALGLGRGDRLGVLMGNEPDWVAICFAAASIGVTLIPVNTWYKRSEIDWVLRNMGLSALIFTPRFLKQDFAAILQDLIPELRDGLPGNLSLVRYPGLQHVISHSTAVPGSFGWQEFLKLGQDVAPSKHDEAIKMVSPEDIALVLQTSGSTAAPKGVMLNHQGLIENSFGMGKRRDIVEEDRVWIGSPLFYGLASANALPVALTHGASIVLQDSFDPGVAIQEIARTQANVYYGTGNMTRAILDHSDFSIKKIGSLKKGNAGISSYYKHMTMVEMGVSRASSVYGMTECYGNVTVSQADDPIDVKINTCGTVLPGMEIQIVNPDTRKPVAPGEVGLVLIRGYTSPGYLDNPAETKRAMGPDGWLNTGDLGSFDAQNRFLFHARQKDVLKVGGINVSPQDVETLLGQHPSINEAHVIGVPDDTLGECIVAFVSLSAPVSADQVKLFVKSRAASFKAPHHVIVRTTTEFPRLASGKIAKHKLKEQALRELTGQA
ncbi:MAG: AMP-binding protein [Marinosulfonomonas sp.]|nr:AMP-binding protein [Marinosulfonomonas sp.]